MSISFGGGATGSTRGGRNVEYMVQVKGSKGIKIAKFSSQAEQKQIKRAIKLAEDQRSTREEFDSLV